MSKRVGVIGYPIRHSISPVFQQAAFDHRGIDARFEAWEVEPGSLPQFIEGLRSPDNLGVNVTVPHKEATIHILDRIDDSAGTVRAVNVVVNKSGVLSGHNTDGVGFLRALEQDAGYAPRGRRVLVLGAGGSAKAVSFALVRAGVASIVIANRTLDRAERLADQLRSGYFPGGAEPQPVVSSPVVSSIDASRAGLARVASESDLIVNCTTLGMKHGPDEGASPITARQIPAQALVYDLVYNPPVTPLLKQAALAGAASLGGLPMLVYQGAAAFELWTEIEAPVEVMMDAARGALK